MVQPQAIPRGERESFGSSEGGGGGASRDDEGSSLLGSQRRGAKAPIVERPYTNSYGSASNDRDGPKAPDGRGTAGGRGSEKGRGGLATPGTSVASGASSGGASSRRVNWSQRESPGEASSMTEEAAKFTLTYETATPRLPRNVNYTSPTRRMRSRQYEQVGSSSGSVSRPDFDDCLRRSAAVLHKHVTVCEWRHARALRRAPDTLETGQFRDSAAKLFEESRYVAPQYEITLFHLAPQWTGLQFHTRPVEQTFATPTMHDIYTFLSTLFIRAHLSSECSIVCLIYVERLMEKANVPLLAATWRPILLCSMLLASKVWQDCASWNIEFSVVFPQRARRVPPRPAPPPRFLRSPPSRGPSSRF